jgi:hypothetical protein
MVWARERATKGARIHPPSKSSKTLRKKSEAFSSNRNPGKSDNTATFGREAVERELSWERGTVRYQGQSLEDIRSFYLKRVQLSLPMPDPSGLAERNFSTWQEQYIAERERQSFLMSVLRSLRQPGRVLRLRAGWRAGGRLPDPHRRRGGCPAEPGARAPGPAARGGLARLPARREGAGNGVHRVDMRRDAEGRFVALEFNPTPATPSSSSAPPTRPTGCHR